MQHFLTSSRNQLRQPLTTELLRMLNTLPSALGELLEGRFEPRRRDHLPFLPPAWLQITDSV
ncbi:hypothetical protein CBM2585_A50063 [Cupriavidus taiwanensis]|nr:hypothetical protein CBM2585_A50063 [Cupriavidus taiwanensis]